MRRLILALGAWVGAAAAASPAYAKLGLAMRFGELVIEHAQVGRTYNLREALGLPLGVENRSTVEVEVLIEVEPPAPGTLAEGYEPIPDPAWLTALPRSMRIGAESVGFFDLLLTVPDDPKLVGRHFQAKVRARMGGTGFFGVGIENKLRFSVGPGPESLAEERKRKGMQRLDFDITPRDLYLSEVPLGRPYDAQAESKKSLRAANFAPEPLELRLQSAAWDGHQPPPGYVPIPEPAWVGFRSSTVTVGPDAIERIVPVIRIPDAPEHRGKKYAALVRTGLASGFWLDAPIRIYVATQGKEDEEKR